MTNADHEEVLSLPDGIFRVKYHRLSVKQIKNLRSRWLSDVFKLRREISRLNKEIFANKKAIEQKEAMLNKLTEENIQKLICLEENKKKKIEDKAKLFLRNLIGDEAFGELEVKGYFCFEGLDGKTYRIKKNGTLQVDGGKYWYKCCHISPEGLPLPDMIASVFNTVKNSKTFPKETSKTKTQEEVTQ